MPSIALLLLEFTTMHFKAFIKDNLKVHNVDFYCEKVQLHVIDVIKLDLFHQPCPSLLNPIDNLQNRLYLVRKLNIDLKLQRCEITVAL